MNKKLAGILLLMLLTVTFSCRKNSQKQNLTLMKWLLGHWTFVTDKGMYTEHWEQADEKTLSGYSLFVVKADTLFRQDLRIENRDGGFFYLAKINSNGHMSEREYLMTLLTDELVFENQQYEFPSRITYQYKDNEHMLTTLEGKEGKNERFEFLQFIRSKGDSSAR